MIKNIKCGNCPFFSGIQCHGHGEFFGSCKAIDMIRNIIASSNKVSSYVIDLKNSKGRFDEILFEDSNCLLFELKKDID